jgi:hypothetical protein
MKKKFATITFVLPSFKTHGLFNDHRELLLENRLYPRAKPNDIVGHSKAFTCSGRGFELGTWNFCCDQLSFQTCEGKTTNLCKIAFWKIGCEKWHMSSHCIKLLHIRKSWGQLFLCMDMIPAECTCCALATLPNRIMKYLKWGGEAGWKGFSHTQKVHICEESIMQGFLCVNKCQPLRFCFISCCQTNV